MNVDINFVNKDVNNLCVNCCGVEGVEGGWPQGGILVGKGERGEQQEWKKTVNRKEGGKVKGIC